MGIGEFETWRVVIHADAEADISGLFGNSAIQADMRKMLEELVIVIQELDNQWKNLLQEICSRDDHEDEYINMKPIYFLVKRGYFINRIKFRSLDVLLGNAVETRDSQVWYPFRIVFSLKHQTKIMHILGLFLRDRSTNAFDYENSPAHIARLEAAYRSL